jgi:hypothetical protein
MERDEFLESFDSEYFIKVLKVSLDDFIEKHKENEFSKSLEEIKTVFSKLKNNDIALRLSNNVFLLSNKEWVKLFVSDRKNVVQTSFGAIYGIQFEVSDKTLRSMLAEAVFENGYQFITIQKAIEILK